jgi:hypothetical protein
MQLHSVPKSFYVSACHSQLVLTRDTKLLKKLPHRYGDWRVQLEADRDEPGGRLADRWLCDEEQ